MKHIYQQYFSKLYNGVVAQLKEVFKQIDKVLTPEMQYHKALVESFKNCYAPGPDGKAELRSDLNTVTIVSSNSAVLDEIRRDILLDTGAMGNSVDAAKTKLRNLRPASGNTYVQGITGATQRVTREGILDLEAQNGTTVALDGTMDVPGSSYDLISVGVLDDAGLITTFANRQGKKKGGNQIKHM